MNAKYRIVIVGAGPVGLAVAALLANSRTASLFDIHLFDAGPGPRWLEESLDLRVYAMSHGAQDVLERSGVWHSILSRRASPYRTMRIWEGGHFNMQRSLTFDSVDVGCADLGHIVEDSLIRSTLVDLLQSRSNVQLHTGIPLEEVTHHGETVTIRSAGSTMTADLLIGADGGRSIVRQAAGIDTLERDYQQLAVVAHVATEQAHRATAWQRFLPGGPIALLPLLDGRSSIVWSLPSLEAAQLVECSEDRFREAVGYATGQVLGSITAVSERRGLPLVARAATSYCQSRIVLVGDAAHTVHPLAGQGVNLGLLDAIALVNEIESAAESGQHPGDLRVLSRYERERKSANLVMLAALDGIDRLFRAPAVFGRFRSLGLSFVDRMPAARRLLINHALGTPMVR